jgi:hypothetical protein
MTVVPSSKSFKWDWFIYFLTNSEKISHFIFTKYRVDLSNSIWFGADWSQPREFSKQAVNINPCMCVTIDGVWIGERNY